MFPVARYLVPRSRFGFTVDTSQQLALEKMKTVVLLYIISTSWVCAAPIEIRSEASSVALVLKYLYGHVYNEDIIPYSAY